MGDILNVARKEFRGFFASPAAYLFMAAFVTVCLFVFFWGETFFARNIADLQPLFKWLPLLLIFLIAALTMRSWSEERRSGTLESLLTAPISLWHLVLGKYLAGMGLLVIALMLTLPLPFTVATLGPLDTGPVIGGYLATLFLGSAYLAIGLFTSSRTDNPIVALMFTTLICGIFWLIGSSLLTGLAGYTAGQSMELIGTGSRFESITRGVLDIRDIYYYLSLTGVFLVLNVYTLERLRWAGNPPGPAHRRWKTATTLAVVNLVFANVWLQPLEGIRADLTRQNLYTLSETTDQELASLQEPLQIRGYFSEKTHPYLAPLVPQLRNLVEEYGVLGGQDVEVRFIDPTRDKEAEQQAASRYGIKPVPFQASSRYETSIVNSYFDLVIAYGDDHVKLGFRDLIEVKSGGQGDLQVALKNPEYLITRAINKLSRSYRSGADTFDAIRKPVTLNAWVSPQQQLPADLKSLSKALDAVIGNLQEKAGDQLTVNMANPDAGNGELAAQLREDYGFSPFLTSLVDPQPFWFHLMVESGGNQVQIPLPDTLTETALQQAVDDAIGRLVPGALNTVALVTPGPASPRSPMSPMRGSGYSQLKQALGENLRVETTDLSKGSVPAGTDLLMLANPKELNATAVFAIDQFLMRGGSVVVTASPWDVQVGRSLSASKQTTGLEKWLAHHGLKLGDSMIMDPRSAALPVPTTRTVGGLTFREIQMVPYPFLADLRGEQLDPDHPVTAPLNQMTVSWPSPIEVDSKAVGSKQLSRLLTTSRQSWTKANPDILPDFARYPEDGFASGDNGQQYLVGAALEGEFQSWFADKKSPLLKTGEGEDSSASASTIIRNSPDSARLLLVSSGTLANDAVLDLISSGMGTVYDQPITLLQNAVDWSLEDPSLLALRGQTQFARTLEPLTPAQQRSWEYANYGLALAGLLLIWLWRKQVQVSNQRRYRNILAEVA